MEESVAATEDNTETDSSEKKKTDLGDLAKVEVTKATISQAFGTLIYPITSEIAAAEVNFLQRLKERRKTENKNKLAEKNKEKLKQVAEEAERNPKNWE